MKIPPEIDNDLRYDLFLIYAGAILIVGITWLYIRLNSNIFEEIISSNYSIFLYILVLWAGIYLIVRGLIELGGNYIRTKDLQMRKYRVKRYYLDKKLQTMPKEYSRNLSFPNLDKDEIIEE